MTSSLKRKVLALLGAVALVWAVVMLVGGDSGLWTVVEARERRADLEQRVRDLESENQRLRDEIRALQEDDAAIERIAREELDMARPGEVVILVPDPGGAEDGAD